MEAEVVIEGQQLLYSNQFDQLTYNADKIVEMTSQLDEVLKRFSYSFSSKDSALIINKNLTAFLYWFVIDALYFPQSTAYEVERINRKRKKKNQNGKLATVCPQSFDDDKFITKTRLLILRKHNYSSLAEIHQTPFEEVIELLEKQLDNQSHQNDKVLTRLSNVVSSEKQNFYNFLNKLKVLPKEGSPLLVYYNFEKQMIREWMDQVENKKYGPRCQVCNRRDRLIKCQVKFIQMKKCELFIHPQCYPKLPKYYQQKDFLCENCQKGLDENTQCIYCPIKGGHFLEANNPQKRILYCNSFFNLAIAKTQGLKIKIKKRQYEPKRSFIHLSCSLWHPELEYNIKKGMIQNVHQVDRKKTQNSCYQCGTNIGVTIPCANQNCRRFYHPQCAQKIDLSTCIINAKNKLLIELYCDRHRRPYIYEILKQNILNNLKQIKKLYEGIDHEIKRMASSSYSSDRKIQIKNEQPQRYDWCLFCRQPHEDIAVPITNCWKCYNWYHQHCTNKCPICDYQPVLLPSTKS